MNVKLYLDEDSSDTDLIKALRMRGVDVVGAQESGMRGRSDLEQLQWATTQKRVLYTANAADFCLLHAECIRMGQDHPGIIQHVRQRYAVGEQMNRLLRLISLVTAEDMQNRLEFLSTWA